MNDTNTASGGDAQNGGVNPPANSSNTQASDDNFFVIPPHPNTDFDENYFLKLLKGSLSLSLEEKKRVLDAIPRLGIKEINELIKIFEQEQSEFSKLEKEFSEDVQKLKQERTQELESAKSLEINKEAESQKKAEEQSKLDALRGQLGGE